MRDEYVGDIGDFGKYILLKELRVIAGTGVKIGINWYYNTRPAAAFRYLFDDDYRRMDHTLFDYLRSSYKIKEPRLPDVEEMILKDQNNLFYRKLVPYSQSLRKTWFQESWEKLKEAEIIFLDPDNGIPPDKDKVTSKQASIDEIKRYYDKGKSIILYQHKNREPNFLAWFKDKLQEIYSAHTPIIIRCPKITVRYYALIAKTTKHQTLFKDLSDELTGKYALLFEKA